MKKVLTPIAFVFIVLVTVILVNSHLQTSKQLKEVPPAVEIKLDKTELAKRLKGAIRFRTISQQDAVKLDGPEFLGFHAFLQKSYPKVHRMLKREVVNDYSLLYTWEGSDAGQKATLLVAHMDVVPPGSEGDWSHLPFSGHNDGEYIWGRGTMDDKVSVLSIFEAVESLLSKGFKPKHTIYLAFGHDEEVGGLNGAAKIGALLRSRNVRLKYVLDEGGYITNRIIPGVSAPVALIGIAEKGYMTLALTVKEDKTNGDCGHSSMPPAQTTIGILSSAIQKLEANPMPAKITGPVRLMFDYLSPEMDLARRVVFANLWLLEPLVKRQLSTFPATNAIIRTTTAVTMIKGGVRENVLPCEATALVNFRILPGDTLSSVTQHVRSVLGDPRITITLLSSNEPGPASRTVSVGFQAIERSVRQIFPKVLVAPSLTIGGTDSKHYVSLSDAIYRFFPLRLNRDDLPRIHGTNERIAIDNYVNAVRFYVQLIQTSSGPIRKGP